MLPRIFIDTSAFLALEDESDQYHDEAIKFHEQVLRRRRYEIVTTSYILDETLTLIRFRVGINASIDFSKKLRKSEVVKIVRVSGEIEERSLDIFERYDDKDFSFTDCVSFVVMQEMGIKEVFAFDHHFNQMGFVRKP
ncbi:MAG: PIN domain-containing protein [Euryarchaeota archaeon]|nr:PIN domain-containing protein [Euryarchaeota archaeon]